MANTMADAAYEGGIPNSTSYGPVTAVGGYLHSPTASHAWSISDWVAQINKFWLPIWTGVSTSSGTSDAQSAVNEVHSSLGLPNGVSICLDIEAQWVGQGWVQPYVNAWRAQVALTDIPCGYTSSGVQYIYNGWPHAPMIVAHSTLMIISPVSIALLNS